VTGTHKETEMDTDRDSGRVRDSDRFRDRDIHRDRDRDLSEIYADGSDTYLILPHEDLSIGVRYSAEI
jgi:hypothetical protein